MMMHLKAVASGLDAAANSGNKLDLTEWQDIQTILNNSSILNDASGSYAAAIEAAAKIIADINSSIDTEFDATSGNDFLSDSARSLAAVAQTDVVSLLSELAASPTPDVASALQSSFNPVQLASKYEDALPGFSALSGTDKVIAGVDRVSMKINTNQTIDLTSNDVLLGSGSVYNVLSLSTNAKDFRNLETITLDGNSDGRSDVRVSLDGNDLQVEALSGGLQVVTTFITSLEQMFLQMERALVQLL